MSPLLIGLGLLEAIPENSILENVDASDDDKDGVSGRANYVPDVKTKEKKLGRFGFKATQPSLEQQTAVAATNDIGLSNKLFPGRNGSRELSDDDLETLVLYQQIPGVPRARNQDDPHVQRGKELFVEVGCSKCHIMTFQTSASDAPELANQTIHPFSDLLLHNMGSGLADKRAEFNALGSEWRTTPLWGVGFAESVSREKALYLHDGRARTIEEAILWHGGEATRSQRNFKALTKSDRTNLILFLKSL